MNVEFTSYGFLGFSTKVAQCIEHSVLKKIILDWSDAAVHRFQVQ